MKRSALKRKTPLGRRPLNPSTASPRKPMGRNPRRQRYTREELTYMAAVRELPCAARLLGHPCNGRMTADHAGKKSAKDRKTHVDTCIPLCWEHHLGNGRDNMGGPFKGWDRARMRRWLDWHIFRTRALIAGRVDTATGEAL